jgi:L-threonate 2-dehydrogenase
MSKTVGIIGLGIMGSAISRNLVERGWRVIGFDIDAARSAELAQANVIIARDVGEVVREASVVMTSLPTPAAVIDVARAIAGSGQPPRIVVELSTLTIADKLRFEAILREAGHIALDCPLSGTGAQARMRDLVVYASGDSAAIARCSDLFADFAKQSADLGAFGNRRGDGAGGARRARPENGGRSGRSGRRRLADVPDARADDGRAGL